MAPNRHFLAPFIKNMMLVFIIVFVAVLRCSARRQSLTPGPAGPAFTNHWPKPLLKKLKITAFSCGVPRCIAALVMRILVMCFQMGRNQLGFAIASIRLHLIFKQTSKQKIMPWIGAALNCTGVGRWLKEATKTPSNLGRSFCQRRLYGRSLLKRQLFLVGSDALPPC